MHVREDESRSKHTYASGSRRTGTNQQVKQLTFARANVTPWGRRAGPMGNGEPDVDQLSLLSRALALHSPVGVGQRRARAQPAVLYIAQWSPHSRARERSSNCAASLPCLRSISKFQSLLLCTAAESIALRVGLCVSRTRKAGRRAASMYTVSACAIELFLKGALDL